MASATAKEPAKEVIPPTTPPLSAMEEWSNSCKAYLLRRGWKEVCMGARVVWSDPMGVNRPKGKLTHEGTLPAQGGGSENLMQWHGPPCPWTYGLEQAVAIQKSRDATLEGIQFQIDRKKEEIADLEDAFLKMEIAKESKK